MSYASLYEKVFGEKYIQEPYKYEPHSFTKVVAGKKCCGRCGLLALNNDFSQWAVDKGCNASDHPSYKSARRKFTGGLL